MLECDRPRCCNTSADLTTSSLFGGSTVAETNSSTLTAPRPKQRRKHDSEYKRAYYLKHRERILRAERERRVKNREVIIEKSRLRYRRNREAILRRFREKYRENPKKFVDRQKKYRYARFRMTCAEYDKLFFVQGGLCAICGQPENKKAKNGKAKRLAVDHSHATGKVRGLLCHRCNVSLGNFEDRSDLLRLAADYLEYHAKQ